MDAFSSFSEKDLLSNIVLIDELPFDPEFARLVLAIQLTDTASERIRELLRRNNSGTITADEKAALDNQILVGQFLDLVKAKAGVSLQKSNPRSN